MTFDISAGAVVGVLQEVNGYLEGYEESFETFQTQLGTVLEACNAEPIANEINGLTTSLLGPALSNIAGRTGNAVSAVNNVVTILTDADHTMSQAAREAEAKTAQEAADDPPPAPGSGSGGGNGGGGGPAPQMY